MRYNLPDFDSLRQVVDETAPMYPRPAFFSGAKLNFAENLLFPKEEAFPHSPALLEGTEYSRDAKSWAQLREDVRKSQAALTSLNLKPGDRVAGYVANNMQAVVSMLAATSLGCIWTALSPDTGSYAVLERLRQIEPLVLYADNATFYNGRSHSSMTKLREVASGLPSLKAVIVNMSNSQVDVDLQSVNTVSGVTCSFDTFLARGNKDHELTFTQLPADHPVYILYSSGTTGTPKCIVHGAMGTLLQHKKEHVLHCSIKPGSRLFYYTTCSWMMWLWAVSGLASGATVVLYDGSPFRYRSQDNNTLYHSNQDDLAMARFIDELQVTHFGTSANYLAMLERKDVRPLKHSLTLQSLEAIYSTASPLAPSTFKYVYSAFPSGVNLASITGGTDIISLFGAPCPLAPVYAGEIQKPGLGMAIRAFDPVSGKDITTTGEPGDLVCTRAFPCQPIGFWPMCSERAAERYREAYFEKSTSVWYHGDYVRFSPATGGLIMLGRSDGVLKPGGVRFGSTEIYNVLLNRFAGTVADALCIGRRREGDADETVVLFVKMEMDREKEERKKFDEMLVKEIKLAIRQALSPRHVPGIVDECWEIPVTANGKKYVSILPTPL